MASSKKNELFVWLGWKKETGLNIAKMKPFESCDMPETLQFPKIPLAFCSCYVGDTTQG